MGVYVHPLSEKMIHSALTQERHAVLLSGKEGSGLLTIAQHVANAQAASVLTLQPEKDEKIDLVKGVIAIEQIRRLYDTLRTNPANGRIVIIDFADRMGAPAQNAFLKLLEEPPARTQFVLLSHYPERLLPTIRSRIEEIDVRPLLAEQSQALLDELRVSDALKRTRILFIADGRPAEITRLAQDDTYYEGRVAIVKDARTFVTGTPYDRVLLAKEYKDSREKALLLLSDAMAQLKDSLAKGGTEASLDALTHLERVYTRIVAQGNVRLQLSSLGAL